MAAPVMVDNYLVTVFSGTFTWSQRIFLNGASGRTVAIAYFFEDGVTMPKPTGADPATGDMITLTYRSKRFKDVVDLLRNEKPIYVFFSEEGGYGAIGTFAETVGDAEF
jgi:hypothetical protein